MHPGAVPDDAPREVNAYPPLVRDLVVRLAAFSLAVLAVLGGIFVWKLWTRESFPTARALWRFTGPLAAGPWAAAWLLRIGCRATLVRAGDGWQLRTRWSRIDIPASAAPRLRQFRLPFPGPGGAIALASGALLRWRLEFRQPPAPLPLLREEETAATRYARERALSRSRLRAWHWLSRWVLLPSLIAAPFFYFEQWFEFGGTLGEYYQTGLAAYLGSFFRNYRLQALLLLVWASLFRVLLEAGALAFTLRRPERARRIRWWTETASRAALYLLYPLVLLWRFAWS